MDRDDTVLWLFEAAPRDWIAQCGWADASKKAMLWWPGKRPPRPDAAQIQESAPLFGCTQVAVPSPELTIDEQPEVAICWLGWDVDVESPEEHARVITIATRDHPDLSIRTSCSGLGVHLIRRIVPVRLAGSAAWRVVVKLLCAPTREALESHGIHVCSSGFRLFWLCGGKNQWVSRTDEIVAVGPSIAVAPDATAPVFGRSDVSPKIWDWAIKLQERGVLRQPRMGGNPCYVGDAIKALRDLGEQVHTVSRCRGNRDVNGYIDITPDVISLWSYADGHTIWSWEDVQSWLEGTR